VRKFAEVRRTLALFVLAHLNAIVFSVGCALVGYGVSRWSAPAACVLLGSVLMLAAAWPYLWPRKSS
jgi:hypothetical protein